MANIEYRPTTLADLIAALQELGELDPVSRARRAPVLIEAAKTVLHNERNEAMLEAIHSGQRPSHVAKALGVSRKTVAARVTPMVIYAYRPKDGGDWVGPHDLLAEGFEDADLHFNPANSDLPLAGKTLVVRYGPFHAGTPAHPSWYSYTTINEKRMRATEEVHDALFEPGSYSSPQAERL